MAHVIPMFNKSGRIKPGNYRSVSLTSGGEKILGKIIFGINLSSLGKAGIDWQGVGSQHVSVHEISCLMNLIVLFEEISE